MDKNIKKILSGILGLVALAILFFTNSPTVSDDLNQNSNNNQDTSAPSEESHNEESKLDAVTFIRCVDGDTIIVDDGSGNKKRVRMIGIDTPESVAHEEERNNEYGVMSSEYTKELLSNVNTLYLEYDIDDDDRYDRRLAYVWLEDVKDTFDEDNIRKSMVNALIIQNGYGIAKKYEPTVAHDDFFHELMEEARSNSTGLWQYQGFKDLWN
ncbi:MAG: thermonuclease family protein [Pseudobutyrivibrio sp.]|nr:thermonuclease family protein [Pseudobutyrivibrio sp.]